MSDIHAGRPSPLLDAILAEPDPQAQREQAQDWPPTQREAVNIWQVYEERLNRLVPLPRTYPRVIRLTRRHRRRELRRYIREHATHRRLWRKRVLVLIDETRLWRGQ